MGITPYNMENEMINSERLSMETAPTDGEHIMGIYGNEECVTCWSDNPVCMLGSRGGSCPPGWATCGDETDNNLPMDAPDFWRPLRTSKA